MKMELLSWTQAEKTMAPPHSSEAPAKTCPQTRFMSILPSYATTRARARSTARDEAARVTAAIGYSRRPRIAKKQRESVRHHGTTAPRHHGTTAPRHHGTTAPRHDGATPARPRFTRRG